MVWVISNINRTQTVTKFEDEKVSSLSFNLSNSVVLLALLLFVLYCMDNGVAQLIDKMIKIAIWLSAISKLLEV